MTMLYCLSTAGDEEDSHEALVVELVTDTARTDVRLSGTLDLVSAPGLCTALDRLRHEGSRHIVLDLAGLDFVGAIGIGVFVDADQALRAVGGTLVLINPNRLMRRLLSLTELGAVLTVE
ncbi:MAG TPA: STAS domain-containing protein [Pseudonocardiaceae bacterium]|nr:STAS domain-containing protein [Pseudonocardiaceae bacterium]